jgi:hypothetical protein
MSATFDHRDTPLPLDYFERKYNVSRTTLWRYRKAGLPAIVVGAKCFVRESDFVRFLEKMDRPTISAAPLKSESRGKT